MNSNQFKIQLFDLRLKCKNMLSKALSIDNILGLSAFVNSKEFFNKVIMITALSSRILIG